MDAGTIISLIAALGIGSWIAKLLEKTTQSRQHRAAALKALSHTETLRWAPQEDGWNHLRSAIHELNSAALIAGVPSSLVRQYTFLCRVAWNLSDDNWEEHGDPAYGGAIPGDIADVVVLSATTVSNAIWRPWYSKLTLPLRRRRVEKAVTAIEDERALIGIKRFRGHDLTPF